jgi:small subunit ribosomal protein S16
LFDKEIFVAVRIRMKKLGRRHRPFFRICAMDSRAPRDGKAIEELGYYDPMIRDVDARAVLKADRIDYWLSVGAQPSEKVQALIKKYGTEGTHLEQQKAALERLKASKPTAPPPMVVPRPKTEEETPAEPAEQAPAAEEASPSEDKAPESGSESGE